jgi:hypothetical protein
MSGANAAIDLSALGAQELRWYIDLIAHARGLNRASVDVPTEVNWYTALDFHQCIILEPEVVGFDVSRICDIDGVLWSTDRGGRWYTKVDGKMEWLQRRLGILRYGRPALGRQDDELICHICGCCACIRLEHIRYQTASEDRLDFRFHKENRGRIRPQTLGAV